MKLSVPTSVTRKVAMTVLKTKKHSPTILFAAGVVGMGATVVTACRATLKLEEVLDHAKSDMDDSRRLHDEHKNGQRDNYSEKDHKQDMVHLYVRTAVRVTKLYAPSVILGVLSVAALTGSHRILTSRNAALTAAYATVEKSFKEYRERVVEEFGEEKDRELRFGSTEQDVLIEDENGKVQKVTAKHHTGRASMYARIFDEYNVNWTPVPESNMIFLKLQQNHLNDKLRARGHLFLNEVYEALGLEHTPAGSQVGWLYNRNNGDDYVDFGVWREDNLDGTLSFMNGWEKGILLDFNVDGVIWDKI